MDTTQDFLWRGVAQYLDSFIVYFEFHIQRTCAVV
jgi:hypothetical protein